VNCKQDTSAEDYDWMVEGVEWCAKNKGESSDLFLACV